MSLIIPRRRTVGPSTASQIQSIDQSAIIEGAGQRSLSGGFADVGQALIDISSEQERKNDLLQRRQAQKIKEDNVTIATNGINELYDQYTPVNTALLQLTEGNALDVHADSVIALDGLRTDITKDMNQEQLKLFDPMYNRYYRTKTSVSSNHQATENRKFANTSYKRREDSLNSEAFKSPDPNRIAEDNEDLRQLWLGINDEMDKGTQNVPVTRNLYSQGVLGLIDQKRYTEAEQWLDTYKNQLNTNIPKLRRNIKSAMSENGSIDSHNLNRLSRFVQNSSAEVMRTGEISKTVTNALDDIRNNYGEKGATTAKELDSLVSAGVEAHEIIKQTMYLSEQQQSQIIEQKFGINVLEPGDIEGQKVSVMARQVIAANNRFREKDPAGFGEQETNKFVNDNQVEWAGKVAPGEVWVNKSLELQAQFGATIDNGKARILSNRTMAQWTDTFKTGTSESKYELLQQLKQYGKYQGAITKETNISPSYQYLSDISKPDALKIMDLIPLKRAEIEPLAEIRKENKDELENYTADQNTYIGYLNTLSGKQPQYGKITGDMAETFLKVLDFNNGNIEASTEMMFSGIQIVNDEDEHLIIQIEPEYKPKKITTGLNFLLESLDAKSIKQLPSASDLFQAERLRDIKEGGVWINRDKTTYELIDKTGFVILDVEGNRITATADLLSTQEFSLRIDLFNQQKRSKFFGTQESLSEKAKKASEFAKSITGVGQ
jgi:hypothetical protein